MNCHPLITIDPSKRFGRPCVRDTRISVGDVLGWLASGMTREEIREDFPHITDDDIRAALAFTGRQDKGGQCFQPACDGPVATALATRWQAGNPVLPSTSERETNHISRGE